MIWFFALVFALCAAYVAMVILFWVGLGRLKNEKAAPATQWNTHISVIIPFRNEANHLHGLLRSLSNQSYPPHSFEIILVNDQSTDNWESVVAPWQQMFPQLRIFHTDSGNRGKKQALSLGVLSAKYPHIAITDADCLLPRGWLSGLAYRFQSDDTALILGPVTTTFANRFQKMQALELGSLNASSLGACSMGLPFMASAANMGLNRDRIGFSSGMLNPKVPSGDDVFLLHAAVEKKLLIVGMANENILVTSHPPITLWECLTQRARWASKAKHYSNPMAIAVALTVMLFNTSLITLAIAAAINTLFAIPFTIVFISKMIADHLLLNRYLALINRKELMRVFLPLQLIYPLYIVATSILSLVKPVRWK